MTSNLKKLTLTSLLAAGMVSAADAPEISMSGYFLSGMFGAMDKEFNHLGSASGNEIDLTTSIKFGMATTVDLYTTMNSAYMYGEDEDGNVVASGSGSGWWPTVIFDGITFTHKFSDDFTFVGGDLIYGAGDFGYYFYKREYSVITEDAVRGFGFMSNGLTLYTGSGEGSAWKTYLGYEVPTPEALSLSLHGEYTGYDGNDEIQAGLVFGFEEEMFSLNATTGMYKSSGSDMGFSVLVEPYVDFGSMNILASVYYQDAGEKENPAVVTDIEDMYAYIEPGFPINDITSFGVTLEYSNPVIDDDFDGDDETFSSWPTLYVAPTDDVLFLTTVGFIQPLADGADHVFGYGLELSGSF